MKIRILKDCSLQVGITAGAGQVLDAVPDRTARALIAAGRAEEWRPLAQELPLPGELEDREPEITHRDPISRTTRRSKRKHF